MTPAGGGADDGADQKDHGQRHRDVAQLAVDHAAHDRLGEDVKQVRAHGQYPLDPGAHQRRGDDEAAAGADAAGDQAGAQADQDGSDEDPGGIEGGAVRLLASEHVGQELGLTRRRLAHLRRKADRSGQDRQQQQSEYGDPPGIAEHLPRHIDLPSCMGTCARSHERPQLSQETLGREAMFSSLTCFPSTSS